MPAISVTREEVFSAANEIAKSAQMPTTAAIRTHLKNRGGEVTLHKYLKQWKKALLLKSNSNNEFEKTNHQKTWKKEYEVEKEQNKILSHEFSKNEQLRIKLEKNKRDLNKNLVEMTQEYKKTVLILEALESKYQALLKERENAIQLILKDKNTQIDHLQEELKNTNKDNLDKIKEMGFYGDEALMNEKVKAIHLSDKVAELTKKQAGLEKRLEKEKKINMPLQEMVKQQEVFLRSIMSWEQLEKHEKIKKKMLSELNNA